MDCKVLFFIKITSFCVTVRFRGLVEIDIKVEL